MTNNNGTYTSDTGCISLEFLDVIVVDLGVRQLTDGNQTGHDRVANRHGMAMTLLELTFGVPCSGWSRF